MRSGLKRGILGLALAALLPMGCVTAYDPNSPARLTLETRAEEVGTKDVRPKTKQPRGMKAAAKPPAPAPTATEPKPEQPVNVAMPTPKPRPAPEAAPVQPEPAPRAPLLPGTTTVKAPPRPAPPPQPRTIPAPETAAGRQLGWWLAVLSGGATKGLEDHFAESFLKQVPGAQVRAIARQWQQDELAGGPADLVEIEPDATPTSLSALVRGRSTDRYTRIRLGVDDAGKVRTLWMGPLIGFKRGEISTWADLDDRLKALPGSVTLAAERVDGAVLREVHAFNPGARMAIGSTFKLFILGALAEEVLAGRARWDEALAISDDLKSLPTGRMQLEAEGAEFPLSTYADLMISISDNTAADHLLSRVGREKAEAYMSRFCAEPARNTPLLSTMDLFRIKLAPDRTLPARYIAADEPTRRAMLAPKGDVATSTPSVAALALWKSPFEIQKIEWFATAAECCRIMADLYRQEQQPGMEPLGHALRINPGLQFDRRTWPRITYKGGSEPGVLNMTWLLERDDGGLYALSLGWNNTRQDVDVKRAADLVSEAVALLAEDGRAK